jgi:hypothetical protein
MHNDTGVKILLKSVKVQVLLSSTVFMETWDHVLGTEDFLSDTSIDGDKICFFQIIICCSKKVAYLNWYFHAA